MALQLCQRIYLVALAPLLLHVVTLALRLPRHTDLILNGLVGVGGARHPTAPDADPVFHFTSGNSLMQLAA